MLRLSLLFSLPLFLHVSASSSCIFSSRPGVLNAAAELSISASEPELGGRWAQEYAPVSLRPFPDALFKDRDAAFFDSLLNRRVNSMTWLWSTVENEEREATGMAHIIFCPVELWGWQGEDRHSLCASYISGDHTSTRKEDRCNEHTGTIVLVGGLERKNRAGTRACWCEEQCMKEEGVYKNGTILQDIDTYVVEEEKEAGKTTRAREYEEENEKRGRDWYMENIVGKVPPYGKGVFPKDTEVGTGLNGSVLVSLRLINVLHQGDEGCVEKVVEHREAKIVRRSIGSVEEELSKVLQKGIEAGLMHAPVRRSSVTLAVAASLATVIALYHQRKVPVLTYDTPPGASPSNGGIGTECDFGAYRLQKLFKTVFLVVCEMGLELLPIYTMLREELIARDSFETHVAEVLNVGNQLGAIPLPSQGIEDPYSEGTSAIMVVVRRNKKTSVGLIATLAGILTLISITMVMKGIKDEREINRNRMVVIDEKMIKVMMQSDMDVSSGELTV